MTDPKKGHIANLLGAPCSPSYFLMYIHAQNDRKGGNDLRKGIKYNQVDQNREDGAAVSPSAKKFNLHESKGNNQHLYLKRKENHI